MQEVTSKLTRVAYLCMEYGLHPDLTIYSGGLGILAGDYMKSVGDLKVPVVGVGILWDEGYTSQTVGSDGKPVDTYIPTRREALTELEIPVRVTVAGKTVSLRAFKVDRYLDGELYLLEPSEVEHRWITKRLYGGGAEDRLAQEIVLGVGGVRLLKALGKEPEVYHFNEGHAVFAGLELLQAELKAGLSLEEAIQKVRQRIVFTTHTPVKAGNEAHALDLVLKMGADCGISRSNLEAIGGNPFNMTAAGLRLARGANAVAELHGQTANEMWKELEDAAPITAITNGVHVPSWQDARIRNAVVSERSPEQRAEFLWTAHQSCKQELLAEIEARAGTTFDEDRLLVGFARRAATYKRADLIFRDPERFQALIDATGVQLVFSGKAHPRDGAGKAMVSALVAASKRWPKNVVFLQNYDMTLGALLTRGADIWLNNPRRPFEASGTSGMKAAMNGVLNVSILDGWWPEGCRHGETGWRIGDGSGDKVELTADEERELDARDLDALYEVLQNEVVPTYRRRADWVRMMAASIEMSSWRFSSDRMLEDYYRTLYAPK